MEIILLNRTQIGVLNNNLKSCYWVAAQNTHTTRPMLDIGSVDKT